MKEITVLSGKGGTGKTSITAALASLAKEAVFCDNDVDAADLHLIFQPKILEENTFFSGWKAVVNSDQCVLCGVCKSLCRFGAIKQGAVGSMTIDPFACEGCRLCERVCAVQAISSERSLNNFWYVSDTRFGSLVHARMGAGEENSGKLVTQVRKRAREIADEKKASFILNDGPPGIGCTTIAALSGTDVVLMVIEPTLSGLHDAQRLVKLINSFNIQTYAIINKWDINPMVAKDVEGYLEKEGIPLLGKLLFDEVMVESMVEGLSVVEYRPDASISKKMQLVWEILRG